MDGKFTAAFAETALVVIIGLVLYIVIAFLLANEFSDVAAMKGHSDRKYFWFCFFFSILGYFLVIALPDRGEKRDKKYGEEDGEVSDDRANEDEEFQKWWDSQNKHTGE